MSARFNLRDPVTGRVHVLNPLVRATLCGASLGKLALWQGPATCRDCRDALRVFQRSTRRIAWALTPEPDLAELRFGKLVTSQHADGIRTSRATMWIGDKVVGAIEGVADAGPSSRRRWRIGFLASSGLSAPSQIYPTLAEARAAARAIADA